MEIMVQESQDFNPRKRQKIQAGLVSKPWDSQAGSRFSADPLCLGRSREAKKNTTGFPLIWIMTQSYSSPETCTYQIYEFLYDTNILGYQVTIKFF